jgi:hypothetical protein
MDDILNPIKKFIHAADEKTKIALSMKLRDLANSLETPDNTLGRIAFGVSQKLSSLKAGKKR